VIRALPTAMKRRRGIGIDASTAVIQEVVRTAAISALHIACKAELGSDTLCGS